MNYSHLHAQLFTPLLASSNQILCSRVEQNKHIVADFVFYLNLQTLTSESVQLQKLFEIYEMPVYEPKSCHFEYATLVFRCSIILRFLRSGPIVSSH